MRSACGHGPAVQLESHRSPQCFQRAPVVEDSARDQYHNMQGRGQGGWGVGVGVGVWVEGFTRDGLPRQSV